MEGLILGRNALPPLYATNTHVKLKTHEHKKRRKNESITETCRPPLPRRNRHIGVYYRRWALFRLAIPTTSKDNSSSPVLISSASSWCRTIKRHQTRCLFFLCQNRKRNGLNPGPWSYRSKHVGPTANPRLVARPVHMTPYTLHRDRLVRRRVSRRLPST